jgi:dihydroorotate dehydrogenase
LLQIRLSSWRLQSENKTEMGGLSETIIKRATEVIRFLSEKSNKAFLSLRVEFCWWCDWKVRGRRLFSAAYTGFIYEGPALSKAINKKDFS